MEHNIVTVKQLETEAQVKTCRVISMVLHDATDTQTDRHTCWQLSYTRGENGPVYSIPRRSCDTVWCRPGVESACYSTLSPTQHASHPFTHTNHFVSTLQFQQHCCVMLSINCFNIGVSEQCFTSPPTQYRLYGRRFLQVKRPNQQYQITEGDATKEKENNENN